ncbi:MAG: hypothetical protein VX085_10420 [Pseudomonadota bacterium]|nr:hypothetical protein [Pseudomonadota bacterium]
MPLGRIICARWDAVHGWAAFTPVADTSGAAGAPKISFYVNQKAQEKGFGDALILGLIGASEAERYRTL